MLRTSTRRKLTWNGDGLGYNYTAVLQPTN